MLGRVCIPLVVLMAAADGEEVMRWYVRPPVRPSAAPPLSPLSPPSSVHPSAVL